MCPTITTEALVAVDRRGVTGLRNGARIAPRMVARGAVALVPTQAGPLDGDHDRVRLHVAAGATLVTVPVAATLALPGTSRLDLHVTVEAGGRLVLDDPPLIVAEAAHVVRRVRIDLAAGAVAAVRDIVVLGRAGEARGTIDSETRVTLDGRPLLHDALRIGPEADHVALDPGHRVIGAVALLGRRDEPALAGPGALRRATASDLPAVEAGLAAAWARFSGSRGG